MNTKKVTIEWNPVKLEPATKEEKEVLDLPDDAMVWRGVMPQHEKDYLVTLKDGFVCSCLFDIDGDLIGFDGFFDEVIAWAEMPEGYSQK